MKKNDHALLILGMFVMLTVISYLYGGWIRDWSKDANPIESILMYIVLNPVYLGVILLMSSRFHLNGFIASLLIIMALDIQSLPHVIIEGIEPEQTTYLFIDSIIYRYTSVNRFVLYVILPIGFMVAAYELVSNGTFVKIMKRYLG